MRSWMPKSVYDAKPWVLIGLGGLLALGIVGGATLQMRQDYRARSKWRRETPP